jgi:GTP-binding protein Era
MPSTPPTRCGTIVLAGRPNAGKSTLLNALVDANLAITSAKPQSTRTPVIGTRTDGSTQLVVVDPPGLLEPAYLLQETMLEEVLGWLERADAILYLIPAGDPTPPSLADLVPPTRSVTAPIARVLTKVDLAPVPAHDPEPPAFLTSAVTRQGVDAVLDWCREQVPEGPFRHAPDDLSVQPLRFFVTEFVREAAFELLEELPYAVAAEVEEFREGTTPVYIRVTLYVERESQKGMVIGRDGRTIKRLGARARERIEALMGAQVFLDLWVKVLPKWRTSAHALRQLGFPAPTSRT